MFRDARGSETRYEYDSLGRLKKTIFPDGTFSHVSYDSFGRRTAQTDQAGKTRRFEYDTAGRLRAVILPAVKDPANGNTLTYPRYEYEYDTYGNLETIRDNVKQYRLTSQTGFNPTTDIIRTYARETTFTYNEMHQQAKRTLPDGRSEYKSYDSDGRLIKAVDFASQVTAYLYDDGNVPSAVSCEKYYDNNDLDEPNLVISYTYDRFGRRITSEVNDLDVGTLAVYKNYYDSQGRLYGLASPQGYIRYSFSDISNRQLDTVTPEASIEDQSFFDKVRYSYDQLGRLDTVTVKQRNSQPVNESTVYSYSPVGSLESVLYPNGITSVYSYDSQNRLERLEQRDSTRIISSYDYYLAADGKRTEAREIKYNGSSYDTTNIEWSYDSLNRLVSEDFNSPYDTNDFTYSYAYDTIGNVLEKQSAGEDTKFYYYDPNSDQLDRVLVGDVNTFYYYNTNGSLIEESNDVSLIRQYSYNPQGRLSGVDNVTGSVGYTYNPEGFRVEASVSSGPTIEYLPDPFNHTGYTQVFKSESSSGGSTVYAAGLDIISQAEGTSDPLYFIYDGHGSTRHLADATGVISESFDYDAYGNSRFDTSAASTNLLYCGEMFDQHTAQYYLRARWYSPNTGRFNRLDPFTGNRQDPQSLHRYLYAHCNPINNIDLTGTFSLTEMVCVAGITGSITGLIAGEVTRILGGTKEQIFRAQWKGFLIGAAVGVIAYGGLWLMHSIWPTLFGGSTTGVITAEQAAEQGYGSHQALREAWRELGAVGPRVQIHHFVQQTKENILRFGEESIHSLRNSIPIPESWHAKITTFTNTSPKTLGLDISGNWSTLREYIQSLTYQEQFTWGMDIYNYLVENGALEGFK